MPGPNAHCPACGAPVDDAWCPSCGLELAGAEADALRDLSAQLAAADAELNAARARRDELAHQLSSRRWERVNVASGPAWSPPAPEVGGPPVAEWNLERVRNVLLWMGAALLALSALTFTAVAWTHLGPGGRAVLLFAVTVLAGAGAVATRDRLPATSGALTGLAIALALVDWQIVRRAGVAPGLSSAAWWAIGTAVVAASSIAFGRIAAPAPARRAAAVLLPTSAVLALATAATAAWAVGLGLSLLAAALIAVDRATVSRHGDAVVHAVVRIEAATAWVAAGFAVIVAAFEPEHFVAALAPAAVMATLALAPGIVFARPDPESSDRVPWAILVILPLLGSALILPSTLIGPVGLLTLAVVLVCAGLAIAPGLDDEWRRAIQPIGIAVGVLGLCVAGSAALVSLFGPLAWLGAAWTGALSAGARNVVAGPHTTTVPLLGWCSVAILAVIGVTIPVATRKADARESIEMRTCQLASAVVFLAALAIVPIAAGAPAYVAWAAAVLEVGATLGASTRLSRQDADWAPVFGLLALVPMIPAVGWAAMTPAASIAALAVLVCVSSAAVVIGRAELLRAAHAALGAIAAMLLAAVIATAAGAFVPIAGFVAALVAGVVLLVGTHLRRGTAEGVALELTGVLGGVVGAALALPSTPWLAATLTAGVPFLLVAGVAHRRVEYGLLALAAALGATWSWLAVADVRVVEAYTLPAALAALAAGTRASRDARARSWLTLGPALVLALGPTLLLALARHDDGRAIAVGCAAVVVVLAGAHRRLQAPIVLGSATLVALAVDRLGPTAARLPRWTMLALAGSLLLWVGTTFERRRADVQRAVRGFERLG